MRRTTLRLAQRASVEEVFLYHEGVSEMKKVSIVSALAALMVTSVVVVMAQEKPAAPKGQEVTVTGSLSCTFCRLAHPDHACNKECCKGCIQAGDPALLTDAEGNMYILLTNEIKKPVMTDERLELAGGKVTVKGLLVKAKGIQTIMVDKMEKAS
jgi:hypothetical protein